MKWFLYIFAFIGLLSSIFFLINYSKHNSAGKKYKKRCLEIEVGMKMETVKMIMGDDDYSTYGGKIHTRFNQDSVHTYSLNYPAPVGASNSTAIYFDPVTQIVTQVFCER